MLDFFAPWCPPCQAEMPDINRFATSHRGQVQVVLMDRGDSTTLIQEFLAKYAVNPDIRVLTNDPDAWSAPYGVTGQPETFFINAAGKIVAHVLGPLTERQMSQYLQTAR